MKILVGCEESQAVTIELRKLGHEAFSCDIQECSGGHPEWHLQENIFDAIYGGGWEMGIFFPPCTDLASSGARHFKQKIADGRQQKAISFFEALYFSEIPKIAVENPIGIMSKILRKPDQIVQPFWFGDAYKKSTCLWLKNLQLLEPTNIVEPVFVEYNSKKSKSGKSKYSYMGQNPTTGNNEEAKRLRSKTPDGLAKAMAEQWTKPFTNYEVVFFSNKWGNNCGDRCQESNIPKDYCNIINKK
jgi:hypothetical protein